MAAAAFCGSAWITQPLFAAQSDGAKDYPNKPIRLIVPYSPGGGNDTTARIIGQKLTDAWGQQVVVDNRTGAAGTIAVGIAAHAIPDGYTISMVDATHAVLSGTKSKLPYELTRDLQALSQVTSLFYVLTISSSVPVKSVNELIAYAKANPGKLNFGSSGTGGLQHLAGEMFAYMAGVKLTHVPFRGGPASITAMLAGETQIGFTSLIAVRPHMASGRLRALAISGAKRSPAVPELPTIAEAGLPGYKVDQWYGVVTSAKVRPAIVKKLSAAIAKAMQSPDVAQRLGTDGTTVIGTSPEQFSAYIKLEIAKWRKLVKDAGLVLH